MTLWIITKKRKFQSLVFPEGFHYSIQNRKYRTLKTNALFELTKCISDSYDSEKQKTHPQKWDGSSLVVFPDEMSNNLLIDYVRFLGFFENKNPLK